MDVVAQSLEQVKTAMTEKLKKFVSNPVVTVVLKESRSRQVFTIGKLNQPGPFAMKPNMTVLQALSAAGGFQEWAETKNIVIIRRNDNREIIIPFNYNELVSGKRVEQNILLEPNDTIVVP
jgi:polysaccharide export outer membrane protein